MEHRQYHSREGLVNNQIIAVCRYELSNVASEYTQMFLAVCT